MIDERLAADLADRYRLERELGRGGMAVVFLAQDLKHDRAVAVKVMHPELSETAFADRFFREIGLAARLAHPNILPLHDSGRAAGRLFYVTPYLEGESLRAWLDREGQLPVDIAVSLAGEIADALDYAHRQGVVHRDIKPDNILISDGHAIVADFGIATALARDAARLTSWGLVLGTPRYMSPEQALAGAVDGRSDIYSLGCVLHECLSGEPPSAAIAGGRGLGRGSLGTGRVAGTLKGMRVPPRHVAAAVQRALAPDPTDRHQRAADFKRAITDAGAGRRRTRSMITGVGAAVLIVAAAMYARWREPAPPARVEPIPLTHFAESATSPALSPDGTMLAFIRGESAFFGPGQIYVKRLPDGEPVQLTNDDVFKMGPRFTPDGGRITYTAFSGPSWDTWIVPVLGGSAQPFLSNAEGLTWIKRAGSARVLFSEVTGRDVQMSIVTATESRAEHRTVYMPPETGMAHRSYLSPDGQHVLLVEMDYYSWLPCRLIPFDGSSLGRRVGPAPAQCTDASWSPDGKWMYFSANAGSGFHVWRQRYPDGAPEQVTFGATEEEGVEFAPDGRSFVTSIGLRTSTVWVHDARGDRQITSQGFGMRPSISPDGKKLYYLMRSGGRDSYISGSLWVADLETGRQQRLVPGYLMQSYDIAADGKRVVFAAADDSTRSPLWLASLDGSTPPRRLVRSDALQAFFGVDGEVVFAGREQDKNFIYRVKEDGRELRKVVQASNVEGVSPDGKWVAVWVAGSSDDDLLNAWLVYPIDGGRPTLICGKCGPSPSFERGPWPQAVSWSRDGRFLYLDLYGSAYAIPLAPGRALPPLPAAGLRSDQEVAALPGARRIPQDKAFVGPNPSLYAFTKVSIQRNIYRVPVQ